MITPVPVQARITVALRDTAKQASDLDFAKALARGEAQTVELAVNELDDFLAGDWWTAKEAELVKQLNQPPPGVTPIRKARSKAAPTKRTGAKKTAPKKPPARRRATP